MFQNTADKPGMGNELDRSKKNLEQQEIINQELQKKIIIVTFAFGLFYSLQSKSFAILLRESSLIVVINLLNRII